MFFWSRFPFVRVVLFFILGILLGVFIPGLDTAVLVSLMISIAVLSFLLFKRKIWQLKFNYLYGTALSLIFLILGYTIVKTSNDTSRQDHLIYFDGGNYYTGKVISETLIKGDYLHLKLDVQAIKDGNWHEATGKVLVYLKLPLANMPGYGDKLLIEGFPQQVSPPLNPEEFDYRQYLAYQNIHHQHFIYGENWRILETSSGFNLRGLSINARNYLEGKLTLFIPQSQELSVAKALILGKKEDLDRSTKETYATAGAMHVLICNYLNILNIFTLS